MSKIQKKEFMIYEPFKDIVGYHIEKCIDKNCKKCKIALKLKRKSIFSRNKYRCKWGLDEK